MNKDEKRPLLVCLSCTRNYGWVTRCFLEINSRWADYIVIVDQMSTDGTREMCAEYKNVILVDDPDYTYKEADRARMALNRAREIEGDKILIYLDIDEILPANYLQTKAWQQIISSPVGAMFNLRWANIMSDRKHYFTEDTPGQWMHRVLHDDGVTPYTVSEQIHVPLLPWIDGVEDICLEDLRIMHFGVYNENWTYAKMRYYQMVDVKQKRSKSLVSIYRQYHIFNTENISTHDIPSEWQYRNVNIYDLIDVVSLPIICQYMKDMIVEDGIERYAKLDIWEPRLCEMLQIEAPKQGLYKLLYRYLGRTQKIRGNIIVRIIDKCLKHIV